jgi:hypothetical protein
MKRVWAAGRAPQGSSHREAKPNYFLKIFPQQMDAAKLGENKSFQKYS